MHEVVQAGGNAKECNGEHEVIGTEGKADLQCPLLSGRVVLVSESVWCPRGSTVAMNRSVLIVRPDMVQSYEPGCHARTGKRRRLKIDQVKISAEQQGLPATL